jgi:pimeloyl-ACP methyl ester carboxylesterase
MLVTRRDLICVLAALVSVRVAGASSFESSNLFATSDPELPGPLRDYHGYAMHDLTVDGCAAHVVEPKEPLPGRPWVWRTMFWDAFPGVDIALLQVGFYVAFTDVGNTFGCPDAMKHFDVFYSLMTKRYGLSRKPTLEGLSRGGLYAYRWAYVNTGKVGCIYGDAPVCDMKSWPGGKGKSAGSPVDWAEAIKDYHFTNEQQMMDFKGNPINILEPIAAAHIPILHVCGDADTVVPKSENTDIVRERYMALGGDFALIVKHGCDHHPHGLADPAPIVNFILAHCATGDVAERAAALAPKPGSVMTLAPGQW